MTAAVSRTANAVKASAEKRTREGVVFMDCAVCGKPMRRTRGVVKRAKLPMTCGAKCRSKGMSGAGNPRWMGGTWIDKRSGYRHVRPDHLSLQDQTLIPKPMPREVVEHRLVMARKLGRWPTKREHVHHVNGDKADNRPENLEILGVQGHSREHREVLGRLAELEAENKHLRAALAKALG